MSASFRLGAFVVMSLLALAAAVFLVGTNEFLFSRTYRLNAPFDNVAGLPNGADVRVGGVHVGTVDYINMPSRPDGKVMVVMSLKNSTREVVRKDSVASILTEGLLGNKYVSVSFGSANAEPVRNGETIQGEPPVDLSNLIQESEQILDSTKVTVKNVEAMTANAKSVIDKIDRGQGTIGGLINDRKVYDNMNQTIAQARVGVTAFQENMQALKKNFFIRGFYNERGYSDPAELTKYELSQLPPGPCLKKFVFYAKDIFQDPQAAKVKNPKPLNLAGSFLEQTTSSIVAVVAYSGSNGNKDQNLTLTRAQATVVREYLVEHFRIDDARVKTKGMGEDSDSTAKTPDQAGRIEIIIYS